MSFSTEMLEFQRIMIRAIRLIFKPTIQERIPPMIIDRSNTEANRRAAVGRGASETLLSRFNLSEDFDKRGLVLASSLTCG